MMNDKSYDTALKTALRVSFITIAVNIALSVFKLAAGFFGNSYAMLSDAVHTASDVVSTVIVIIGVRISHKKSDSDHQYGHERFECVASIVLAVILAVTGLGIGSKALIGLAGSNASQSSLPGILPLIAAVVSIAVKEAMYWYTRAAANKTDSDALRADAWHHRSDAFSSVGAFAGIFAARLGFPAFDFISGIIICVFILKAAIDIFKSAANKLVDKACNDETVNAIKQIILSQDGVMTIDKLNTRIFGSKIYVDIEISADENLSLKHSHEIAERVHSAVETDISDVKHCTVHVNPSTGQRPGVQPQ